MPLLDSRTLYEGTTERDVRLGHPLVRLSHGPKQTQSLARALGLAHSNSDTGAQQGPAGAAGGQAPQMLEELVNLFSGD